MKDMIAWTITIKWEQKTLSPYIQLIIQTLTSQKDEIKEETVVFYMI